MRRSLMLPPTSAALSFDDPVDDFAIDDEEPSATRGPDCTIKTSSFRTLTPSSMVISPLGKVFSVAGERETPSFSTIR